MNQKKYEEFYINYLEKNTYEKDSLIKNCRELFQKVVVWWEVWIEEEERKDPEMWIKVLKKSEPMVCECLLKDFNYFSNFPNPCVSANLVSLVLKDFTDKFSFSGIAEYLIEPIYEEWVEEQKKKLSTPPT